MSKPSTYSVVLCEDIRTEDNGKLLFIGVYPSRVLVNHFPANLRFSFWISGKTCEEENKAQLEVSVINLDSSEEIKVLKSFALQIKIAESEFIDGTADFSYAIINLPIKIEDESLLRFKVKPDGGKWKEIGTRKILLNPKPTLPSPPSELSPDAAPQ